jgi:hypothetical protein
VQRHALMAMKFSRRTYHEPQTKYPGPDDLKDWATIGLIVITSSLLVWGPLLIG